ncbi:hypothetical protein [Caulobacter sp. FWC2]|uniref:hypothetical protein n=1 Tax=Caulobacter sp. FWC2 TaxID=69664 RepID=UPI000C14F427|nr:hypothetical protein [Caulobacter sp. FWC2]PIB93622.1 hypothetical protein CSW62_19835 [Caulobacter sp. FWC2]
MRPLLSGLMAAALLIAAPSAWAAPKPHPKGEAKLAEALAGRVAAAPLDCIDPRSAETVEIIDRTAILYRMPGGALYVNRPDAGASELEWDSTLTSRTVGARLCHHDTMTAARFSETSFVMLGPFIPYSKVTTP